MNGEINKSLKKINVTVEMKNLNIKSHPNLKEENAHSNARNFCPAPYKFGLCKEGGSEFNRRQWEDTEKSLYLTT